MSLLCIFKKFQNEQLDSKGFELGCVLSSKDRCEVTHPMEQRKKLVRERMWRGIRGKRGGPSEH